MYLGRDGDKILRKKNEVVIGSVNYVNRENKRTSKNFYLAYNFFIMIIEVLNKSTLGHFIGWFIKNMMICL
jgi:hypothetical protein